MPTTAPAADQATDYAPLLRRPHTVLGVCEAIGEDFGFNPVYLRIAFAAGLFFNLAGVIALYIGLGAVVALSRWISPVPATDTAPTAAAVAIDYDQPEMKIAA